MGKFHVTSRMREIRFIYQFAIKKLDGTALFQIAHFPHKIEHENFIGLLHDVTDDHLIQGKFLSGHAFCNPNYATGFLPTPAGRNTY